MQASLVPAFPAESIERYPYSADRALSAPAPNRQIAFIDSAITAHQWLIEGVLPDIDVVLLEPGPDGIQQITAALSQRANLTAIHLIVPGSPGCVHIGSSDLSLATVDRYSGMLKQWQKAFAPDADILIYGCSVAVNPLCPIFPSNLLLKQLQQLTGANVAASAKLIGSAALGGSWQLEVRVGRVKTPIAFPEDVRQTYPGILALL